MKAYKIIRLGVWMVWAGFSASEIRSTLSMVSEFL